MSREREEEGGPMQITSLPWITRGQLCRPRVFPFFEVPGPQDHTRSTKSIIAQIDALTVAVAVALMMMEVNII